MAKILMLAFDTFGADSEQDRFAYKIGHIVDVKPDTHVWGSAEGLPKFWRINLPGISVDKVIQFIDDKVDLTKPNEPVLTCIRKWKMDANALPTAIRNTLVTKGEITITKQTTFDGYMKLV